MQTEQFSSPKQQNGVSPWMIGAAFVLLAGFLVFIWLGLQRAQAGAKVVGEPSPDFELTTFDGQVLQSEALRGKVIVLNFWASWCETCSEEAGFLEQAWQRYADREDVIFVGVAYADSETKAKLYLTQNQVTYPNGPDLRTVISQAYRVTGVPETYIIDKMGRITYIKIGPFLSVQEIVQLVEAALQ
jgi:peroxiredoxin